MPKVEMRNLPNDQNPKLMYSLTHTELLCGIVNGDIDAVHYAKIELCNRGVDTTGNWVGFMESEKVHFPDGRPQDTDQ